MLWCYLIFLQLDIIIMNLNNEDLDMDMSNCMLVDWEFTRLPNFFNAGEFLETKIGVVKDGALVYKENWVHKTKGKITKGSYFICRITPDEQTEPEFTGAWLKQKLAELSEKYDVPVSNLWGFSPSSDMKILRRAYGITDVFVNCLFERMQCTEEYEYTLATQGKSMAFCHYLITDKLDVIAHKGTAEVDALYDILMGIKNLPKLERLRYLPFSEYFGQSIADAVRERRGWAFGFAKHNPDSLVGKALAAYL